MTTDIEAAVRLAAEIIGHEKLAALSHPEATVTYGGVASLARALLHLAAEVERLRGLVMEACDIGFEASAHIGFALDQRDRIAAIRKEAARG
jgi:hypothetical protein